VRASIIGFAVMALFAVAGAKILSVSASTLPAFRVAGGFLLFFIAFEMVFERRQDRKEKISDVAITKDLIHNIAAFPLAIPLIAGPGAISATVLLSGSFQGWAGQLSLVAIIMVCLFLTYVVFVLAERIDRFLGNTGRSILTRLLGVILAALCRAVRRRRHQGADGGVKACPRWYPTSTCIGARSGRSSPSACPH